MPDPDPEPGVLTLLLAAAGGLIAGLAVAGCWILDLLRVARECA